MEAQLHEIVELGGPAQSAQAERLVQLLTADPADPVAASAARDLIEAYLHDPDLVR